MKPLRVLMKRIREKSFRKRLLLSMFVLSIVPLVVIGGIFSILTRNTIRKQYAEFHASTLTTIDRYVSIILNNLERSCRLVLSNDALQSIMSDDHGINWSNIIQLGNAVPAVLYDNPDILDIYLIGNDGSTYICGRNHNAYIVQLDPDALAEMEWYQNALSANGQKVFCDGNAVTGEMDSSISCCKLLKSLDLPVGGTQKTIGTLVIRIQKETLFSCLSQTESSEAYCVYDEKGELAYLKGDESLLDALDEITWVGDTGESYAYAGSRILNSELKWTIVNIISMNQLLGGRLRLVDMVLYLTLLMSVVVSLVFLLLERSLYRPLKELESSIVEATMPLNDSQSPQLHAFGDDEIGKIGRKFNEMLLRIHTLNQKIVAQSVRQKEAELRDLQAKINPHFLYNTLDCIYWNACMNDDREVARMILSLSKTMRNSFNQGKNLTTVGREFQNLKDYLYLMECRHKGMLHYEINLDPAMENYTILNLLLQPFVENSILHGLETKTDKGMLVVSGRLVGKEMVFVIQDDGIGMDQERLNQPGYGISNVRKRLELFYEDRHSLDIRSEPGKGTVVELRIGPKEDGTWERLS